MKILSIIPYTFYPPMNGGSLRCFYLLREMARQHEVHLLTVQSYLDFQQGAGHIFPAGITIHSIPDQQTGERGKKNLLSRIGAGIYFRWMQGDTLAATNSYFLESWPVLKVLIKKYQPDLLVYENLEAVGLFTHLIKKQFPSIKQWYDAHNVDSILWDRLWKTQGKRAHRLYATDALKVEQQLHKTMDAVLCCSETDKIQIEELNGNVLSVFVIPNGVDCTEKKFIASESGKVPLEILFCGSLDYFPNQEGISWFYNQVFPKLKKQIPGVVLALVGGGELGEGLAGMKGDDAVKLKGRVADLSPFYREAGICIAPILSGSGTRLKILEAMSFGRPVVSTSLGAAGIEAHHGKHILLADDAEAFTKAVIHLISQPSKHDSIRQAARLLVSESYDWRVIGTTLINHIGKMKKNIDSNA